jgi:hypothetical protein
MANALYPTFKQALGADTFGADLGNAGTDIRTESTSALICFLDTGVTGLPVTPNGGDITITWNASGIFAL